MENFAKSANTLFSQLYHIHCEGNMFVTMLFKSEDVAKHILESKLHLFYFEVTGEPPPPFFLIIKQHNKQEFEMLGKDITWGWNFKDEDIAL